MSNITLTPVESEAYRTSRAKWKYEDKVRTYLSNEDNIIACREEFNYINKPLPLPTNWYELEKGKFSSRYTRCCISHNTCNSLPRISNLIRLINDMFFYTKHKKETSDERANQTRTRS